MYNSSKKPLQRRFYIIWSIALFEFCLSPSMAVCDTHGDKELLKLVAMQNRTNRDAIRTWRGKVDLVQTTTDKKANTSPIKINRIIVYTCDCAKKKMIFLSTDSQKSKSEVSQAREARSLPRWGAIRTSEGYYRVSPVKMMVKQKGKTGKTLDQFVLRIETPSKERRGDFSRDFDPFLYLEVQEDNVHDRLMFLYDNWSTKGASNMTVSRVGDLVTLVLERPTVAVTRFVFDLNQGANPVRIDGDDSAVKERQSREYTQISGVWLPKLSIATNTNLANGVVTECSVEWKENVVNLPISDDAFTPDKLGLSQGDLVRDTRTGGSYHYDVDALPSELRFKEMKWSVVLVVLLLLGAGVFIGVVRWWAVRGQRKAGGNEVTS